MRRTILRALWKAAQQPMTAYQADRACSAKADLAVSRVSAVHNLALLLPARPLLALGWPLPAKVRDSTGPLKA
jgi:uncharacterized membrane protein YccC